MGQCTDLMAWHRRCKVCTTLPVRSHRGIPPLPQFATRHLVLRTPLRRVPKPLQPLPGWCETTEYFVPTQLLTPAKHSPTRLVPHRRKKRLSNGYTLQPKRPMNRKPPHEAGKTIWPADSHS